MIERVLVAVVLLGLSVPAQNPRRVAKVQEDLTSKRRKLTEVVNLEERLLEIRIRHDLGLPIRADTYFSLTEEERDLVDMGGRDRERAEEAEVLRLSEQLITLQAHVQDVQQRVRDDALRQMEGSGRPLALPDWPIEAAIALSEDPEPSADPPARPETEVARQDPEPLPDEPRVAPRLIRGSTDHSAVGRALLHAGEVELRRARQLPAGEPADAARARALGLLEDARRELTPLSRVESPALIDLFYLARCEEKLGNVAAADSLWTEIMSRDFVEQDDGTKLFGRWGMAAHAAKSVLGWLTDTGAWQPVRKIESIRWDQR